MQRGEIYITEFDDPPVGHEQGLKRPSIIVQIDAFNEALDTVIVVPTTTNLKQIKIFSSVMINAGDGGLPEKSVALCNQIRVMDKTRLIGDPLGRLSVETFNSIRQKLAGVLGISQFYK